MDISTYNKTFSVKKEIEFEYQSLCQENEKYFGKGIWALPHRVGITDTKLREAIEIAKRKEKTTIAYLIGILRNLK